MIIASCGDYVEDIDSLYEIHKIYYDVGFDGETVGVLSGVECKECFDKAIKGGYGYKTEDECWKAVMENKK